MRDKNLQLNIPLIAQNIFALFQMTTQQLNLVIKYSMKAKVKVIELLLQTKNNKRNS